MFMVMHNSNEKLLLAMRSQWIHFRDFVFKFPVIIFLRFQGWGLFYFCSCFIGIGTGLNGCSATLIRSGRAMLAAFHSVTDMH